MSQYQISIFIWVGVKHTRPTGRVAKSSLKEKNNDF